MGKIENIRMGACGVIFDNVSLGHTKDGAEFQFERSFEDLMVDQYGETAVDKALTGQKLTVKVFLAEPSVANLHVAMPEQGHASGGNGERVGLGVDAGALLRQYAKELVLHPLKNAANDDSEDIHIYKAVSVETVPMNYKVNEQRIIEVTFQALVDETYGNGRRLGHIGPANIS
jgi:hypothetical protein